MWCCLVRRNSQQPQRSFTESSDQILRSSIRRLRSLIQLYFSRAFVGRSTHDLAAGDLVHSRPVCVGGRVDECFDGASERRACASKTEVWPGMGATGIHLYKRQQSEFFIASRFAHWEAGTGPWKGPAIGPFQTRLDLPANSSVVWPDNAYIPVEVLRDGFATPQATNGRLILQQVLFAVMIVSSPPS